MELAGKVVVVTGGGSGIGEAMCRAFAAEGAAGIAVADIDVDNAERVAGEIASDTTRAFAMRTDVAHEPDVQALVSRTETDLGPIDLFCANAGIIVIGGAEVPDDDWDRIIAINLKSHIYAARAVLPGFRQRGEGYLLHTASAAGLLTQLGSAPYSVTKHAVVGLAEWLSITHGDDGVTVSCLCPQAVATNFGTGGVRRRPASMEPGKGTAGRFGRGRTAHRGVPDPPPRRGRHLRAAPCRRPRAVAARHATRSGRDGRSLADRGVPRI